MQASAALKNVATADNGVKTKLLNFEITDKFAPTQKMKCKYHSKNKQGTWKKEVQAIKVRTMYKLL